ncbi:histidinol dehydrogenase [Flavobacteriaceae bacterium MAR_2010_188]|nr:histidinol dehydrogenase [Flavobacteriaceae bacterium MAR_2010_188]
MKIIENPNREDWTKISKRPTQTIEDIEQTVSEIFKDIKRKGDKAVFKYTELFDGVKMNQLLLTEDEILEATKKIPESLKNAIDLAKTNISKFHESQIFKSKKIETSKGVVCWQEKRPIEKVGLYIPGGTAPLFSSVLMLAIPANIAGCKELILCSPPNKQGKIADAILYTANLCGITKIYKIGGIQAIAAMTFGTNSVEKVYKIFGPGNQFVTIAKQLATKFGVAIDMPAGPSELLVFADDSAKPSYVASDLLSQAEHGADSQVILVSTSKEMIKKVSEEVDKQIKDLPRVEIAKKAIKNSKLILVESDEKALEMINEYAPEHFIICSENEDFFINGINNAGSVFIGNYTPESAGDYASGTNHTLPTNGFSKAYSGVNLESFLKSVTFQKISEEGIKNIGPSIEELAAAEGLQAHKNSVTLRLSDLTSK